MHTSTIIIGLSGLASTAHAIANPGLFGDKTVPGHENAGVYWCVNRNWQRPCDYQKLPFGQCKNFIGASINSIGSIGPDKGVQCKLFAARNCGTGATIWVSWPGFDDMISQTQPFGNGAQSIWCRVEQNNNGGGQDPFTPSTPIQASTTNGLLVAAGPTPTPPAR